MFNCCPSLEVLQMKSATINNHVLRISTDFKHIPKRCFFSNVTITHIMLNNVETLADECFHSHHQLKFVDGPKVTTIGN